jgi:hypothetical protein
VPRWPNAAATVATCRFLRGDTDGAISLARSALAHADRSRSAPALLRRVTAQSLRAAGDLDAARREFVAAADVAEERGALGLVMELRVDVGLALVELDDHDAGVALIEQMVAEAEERGAPINRCWARAALASARRRREDGDALPFIRDVLDEARNIGYPAGITFALRLLAAASLECGDTRTASAALIELLDHLLQRGGLDEMRVVLDLVAEVMRRHDLDGWADVAATAAELPITSFLTPTELDFLPVDRPAGSPLATRDAYVLARSSLLAVLADDQKAAPADRVAPVTEPHDDERSDGDAPEGPTVAAEGDVWRLTWGGETIRVKASKGIDDLVALLGAPGREISALDLMGGGVAPGAAEDELLDDEARRQYEQRVRELQTELDEADAHHDVGRSERLRAELDAIVDELTSALGLGGRSRRTSGAGERARSAVTQRIRSTIKRIEEHHPGLGDHLRRSVSTGTFCRYEPAEPVRWTIRR